MKLTKPIAFFDIESTGVDPSKDRIVEIAIIRFDDDLMALGQGTSYRLNPTILIPKEASDVHGITDEMVKDCPTFKQAYDNILADLEGCDLGTFNGISFDIPMLNAEFARVNINFPLEGNL